MSDAGFTLKVDDPSMPKGELIGIHGLGEFENGSSTDISSEQAEMFSLMNSTQEPVLDEETGEMVGVKTIPGAAIDEVQMNGITVEKAASKAASKKSSGGDK